MVWLRKRSARVIAELSNGRAGFTRAVARRAANVTAMSGALDRGLPGDDGRRARGGAQHADRLRQGPGRRRGFPCAGGPMLDRARRPRTSRPISPSLGARGLSPATAARRRAAVRQFYRFVLGEGWRDGRSLAPGRRAEAGPAAAQGAEPRGGRPADRRRRRPRTAPQGLRLACMVELIYASGLRDFGADRPAAGGAGPRSGLSDRAAARAARSGWRR